MRAGTIATSVVAVAATILLSGFVFGASLQAAPAPALGDTVELPSIPDPVAVQLDPAATAVLAPDLDTSFCAPNPASVTTLPAVQSVLTQARRAGVIVVYSIRPVASAPNDAIVEEIAAAATDAVVRAPADKFFNSNLNDVLQQANVKTAVVMGTYANESVVYTSYELGLRGYTVIVPVDGISSPTDFRTFMATYQLLNPAGPAFSNPDNTPLKSTSVTLSRTDLSGYR